VSDRDWEAEMRKIDRQLESVSDEAILPSKGAKSPAARAQVEAVQKNTSTFGVFARLTLAVTLGVAIIFWPYAARCGLGLAGYLGVVATLITAGAWSSIWTWRHRAAKAHTLSLLLVLWGLVLAALDVLPRVGYAKPTAAHPAQWSCS
jgi:putative flippase GtrA